MDLETIKTFLNSSDFQSFWEYLSGVTFWISVILLPPAVWLFVSQALKYEKARKELNRTVNEPGMEDFRNLFRRKLREMGIKLDDKQHEKN